MVNINHKKASRWGLFLCALLLIIWVFKDLGNFVPLLYDDPDYLSKRSPTWGGSYWVDLFTKPVVNLWHPVTVLSHDLCAQIGGESGGWVWKHHAVNHILHVFNGGLVSWWLFQLGASRRLAIGVAMLWFVHPVLVEPVAWVSGRKDLLAGVFSLLALGIAARTGRGAREEGRTGSRDVSARLLVWLGVLAAVGSKPVAVVLPLVLILQEVILQRKSVWELEALGASLKKYGELLLISAGVVVITLFFQREGGQGIADGRSVLERGTGGLWALGQGGALWLFPHELHTAYNDPKKLSVVVLLLGLPLVGTLVGLIGWKRTPWAVRLGLVLFLLFLLPTIGLVRAGNHLVADRYLYLPGLGLTLVWGGLLVKLPVRVYGFGVAVLILGASLLSEQQRRHWVNTRAVFMRVLAVEPEHSYALGQLGSLERMAGEEGKALAYFESALKLDPGDPIANWNRAEMEIEQRDFSSAYVYYGVLAERWGHEAWVHQSLAKLAWNLQRPEQALLHAQRALKEGRTPTEKLELRKFVEEMKGKKARYQRSSED